MKRTMTQHLTPEEQAALAAIAGPDWKARALASEEQEAKLRERLQAIIDWADFALKHPEEFDSHGVRNLDGPVFDEARAALRLTAPADQPKPDLEPKP